MHRFRHYVPTGQNLVDWLNFKVFIFLQSKFVFFQCPKFELLSNNSTVDNNAYSKPYLQANLK